MPLTSPYSLLQVGATAPVGCGLLEALCSSGAEADGSASCVVAAGFWASGLMSASFWSSKTAKLKCAVKSSSALSGISRDAWFLAVCSAECIWSYCSTCEFCTIAIVYAVKVFFITYNVSQVSVCRAT